MSSYEYATLKNYFLHFLSREDFNSMITAGNIEDAIKSIVDKPVGNKLYEVIRLKSYSLDDLYKELDRFSYTRIVNIMKNIESRDKRLLEAFNRLFDIINIWSILVSLNKGRKPSPIYPVGIVSFLDLSKIEDQNELLKLLPGYLLDVIKYFNIYGLNDPYSIIKVYEQYRVYPFMDYRVRRIYGFIRDSILIRICLSLKQLPSELPSTIMFTYDELIEACNVKEFSNLPNIISGFNPMYSGFGDLLSDLFKIMPSYELFDLGILLYASNITNDLLYSDTENIVRIYIIGLAEILLTKTVLSTIHSGLYIDEMKNIIQRWWVL